MSCGRWPTWKPSAGWTRWSTPRPASPAAPGGADPGGGTGGTGGTGEGTEGGPGSGGDGGPAARRTPAGTLGPGGGAGEIPAGFAARVNLTIPLATLLGLAERPGTLSRTGPVDPALARELAAAAARSPRSTWCITVTGTDHRPLAHGCGRPPPRDRDKRGTARPPATGPFISPAMTTARPEPAPSGWTSPPSPGQPAPTPARRRGRDGGGPGVRAGEPGRAVRPQVPGEGP